MKKAARDFWEGLTATTASSWVGVLLFCLLEVSFCCWLFQPRRMARMNKFYIMETAHDEYAELSMRLLAFKYSNLSDMPHVAFFGPSNATRSLVAHDDETLSRELTRLLGSPAHFDVFTTNNQRLEDALQIIDQFPATFHGAVFIQVNDAKDDYSGGTRVERNRRRLALPSTPSIVPLWRAQGVRFMHTGIFFLDNFEFFAARRTAALRWQPVPDKWNAWGGRQDPEKLAASLAKFEEQKAEIEAGKRPAADRRRPATFNKAANQHSSRKVLAKLISVMKKKNVPVVFVEAPRLPSRAVVHANRIEMFHQDAEDFCAQTGCQFWDFNPDLELKDNDFQDSVHLGSRAKRRVYTDLLLGRMAEVLRAEIAPPSEPAQQPDESDKPAGLEQPDPGDLDAGQPNEVDVR